MFSWSPGGIAGCLRLHLRLLALAQAFLRYKQICLSQLRSKTTLSRLKRIFLRRNLPLMEASMSNCIHGGWSREWGKWTSPCLENLTASTQKVFTVQRSLAPRARDQSHRHEPCWIAKNDADLLARSVKSLMETPTQHQYK